VFPVGDPGSGHELGTLRDMIVAAISMSLAGGASRASVTDLLADLGSWVRQLPSDETAQHALDSFNAASRLLQYWATEGDFLDASATPRVLSLAGRSVSFATLVRRAGGFATPAAALEVLERHGAVRREGRSVRLLSRTLIANWQTSEARERALAFCAAALRTFSRNVSDRPMSEKRYERTVLSSRFPVGSRAALREHLKLHSEALLVYIDQLMKTYEQAAEARGDATEPIGFGLIELDFSGPQERSPSPRRTQAKKRTHKRS
jgi:hypothetical protein